MKIPVLSGSRVAVVTAPENAVVLRPPPPAETVAEIGAAVRDAMRFPLAGSPLEALVAPGGTATIVVDHPSLPIPSAQADPRQEALFAVVDELERFGIPSERQTLLVAGGLERKAGRRERERLGTPELARRFHGRVEVHDVEDPALVEIGSIEGIPLEVNPLLLETGLVVTLTAAETVLHGGPAALLAAGGPAALREAGAQSLLEASGSRGWDLGVVLERAIGERVPLLGISLVLDHPRLGGALRGFPHDRGVAERLVRSPLASGFRFLPSFARRQVLRSVPVELKVMAVYSGPPSVAHAEALLRAVEARSARSTGSWTRSASESGRPAHTFRATTRTRCSSPTSRWGSSCGSGATTFRSWKAALRFWSTTSTAASRGLNGRTGRSSPAGRTRTAPPATRMRLPPTAREERASAASVCRLGRVCTRARATRRGDRRRLPGRRGREAPRARADARGRAALEMARGRAGRAPRIGFVLSPPYFPLAVRG